MKTKILLSLFTLIVIVVACNKDTFQTRPSLKLNSTSEKVIPINGSFTIDLDYTDKEGDISDTVFIAKTRMNIRPAANRVRDTLRLTVPEVPNKIKGVIQLNLTYTNHLISALTPPTSGTPARNDADTLRLKIYLRDKAKNVSDTVFIDNVVVIR